MKILSLALGFSLLATPVLAHGPEGHSHHHGHKIKATKAQIIAKKVVAKKIKKGKLAPSWAKVKPNKPTQKDFGHGPEWVVTFDNPKVKDKKKKRLFVFMTMHGEVTGSNFTGN